jgi:hypothetical protein
MKGHWEVIPRDSLSFARSNFRFVISGRNAMNANTEQTTNTTAEAKLPYEPPTATLVTREQEDRLLGPGNFPGNGVPCGC